MLLYRKCANYVINDENNYTDYQIKRYELTYEQKKRLKRTLKRFKTIDVTKIGQCALRAVIQHLFLDVIPLGMFHFSQFEYEQFFACWFMDQNLSFNEINTIIQNSLTKKEYTPIESSSPEYLAFDKERYETLLNLSDENLYTNIMFARDHRSRIKYPLALYLGFISDSLNNVEKVSIEGKTYDAYHIRDSFVHGRWFFGEANEIELYDCKSGNDNDYNFNWHETINMHELLAVMDHIYNSKQSSRR